MQHHSGTHSEVPEANQNKGDKCPYCEGVGRIKTGHSFLRGNIYTRCFYCEGTGLKETMLKFQKSLKGFTK